MNKLTNLIYNAIYQHRDELHYFIFPSDSNPPVFSMTEVATKPKNFFDRIFARAWRKKQPKPVLLAGSERL